MKKILILLLALLPMVAIQAKPNKQTVVLYCDLHCQGCCDKIMKNIAFEKGVKDIQFDMEQQAVTVTYDADKTDVPTLQKAFAKIGKPATPIAPSRQSMSMTMTTSTKGTSTKQTKRGFRWVAPFCLYEQSAYNASPKMV